MDGFGLAGAGEGNAIWQAYTPTIDRLARDYPNLAIKAHGKAVGLPSDDDMGNSEVGHNALGAGRVYNQGAKLVREAIECGEMFRNAAWAEVSGGCAGGGGTLHFIGLLSDGNVHSHIGHLKSMVARAKQDGVGRVRAHILLDGRDVGETSALDYVLPFEAFLSELTSPGFDARIASGGGRMRVTMDRYEADWGMVETGWKTHVLGEGRAFGSAEEAVRTLRGETGATDQFLPPFVIAEGGEPVGPILDGDSVVFFNFRGDRALEISQAFERPDFGKFDRKRWPKVTYAGMLQYDGDLGVPRRFLVSPPNITETMGEYLAETGVSQLALSETQKFGHVTYFWNGNRQSKFSDRLEEYVEIPSDMVPFERKPWMKAAEITAECLRQLRAGRHRFLRLNFPNGDMVGHTGDYQAAAVGVGVVDMCLASILPAVDEVGGIAIITADHGNADEMYEVNRKTGEPERDGSGRVRPKTAHTLNPVPLIIYDNVHRGGYAIKEGAFGLSNFAATAVELMGFEAPGIWDESVLSWS